MSQEILVARKAYIALAAFHAHRKSGQMTLTALFVLIRWVRDKWMGDGRG